MRSKGLPARALFRLVTTHSAGAHASQASSAGAASSSAATSAATASAATAQQRNAQAQRHQRTAQQHAAAGASTTPSRSFRRKHQQQQLLGFGSASNGTSSRGRRSLPSTRLRQNQDATMLIERIKKMLDKAARSSQGGAMHGAMGTPSRNAFAIPPPTSLFNVAMQAFYAQDRPLLEYLSIPFHKRIHADASAHVSNFGESAYREESQATEDSAEERSEPAELKHLLMSAHSAISEIMAQTKEMSSDELSQTTFVIAASEDDMPDTMTLESMQKHIMQGKAFVKIPDGPSPWPKRLEKIDFARFSSIVDRLAEPSMAADDIVKDEVDSIAAEEMHKHEVQSAVEDALEYGENTESAQALGREAELIILGEPRGANPKWARGVATHLAQNTRAFEPPPLPMPTTSDASQMDAKVIASNGLNRSSAKVPAMSRKPGGAMMLESDDDPNLLLSHAMVQARLPPALAWDRLVAQMDAATVGDETSDAVRAQALVDVKSLNADMLESTGGDDVPDFIEVNLDSVRRKRRKKMRKHKYKKFRKATRTERSRLKK